MVKVLEILKEFMREVEKNNPFNLVIKGGTALSLYYLNNHRESEDLDFDIEKHFVKDYEKIRKYFSEILKNLKEREIIKDYRITKVEFASTERYHIKLEIETYKKIYSKIDVDFVDIPDNLIKKGELRLYFPERLFVGKSIAFINRKEFKDIYDLSFLMKKIKIENFKKKENVVILLEDVIGVIQKENTQKMFRLAFRNVDLRFKDLKESQIHNFCEKLIRDLRVLNNKLNTPLHK